jgi:NAD(P)-dependent dehydrogenase (short-subunit alcohol dehydrogenase family)
MSDVCVVTGGGSGMGLSAALQMQKDKLNVIEGITFARVGEITELSQQDYHEKEYL